MGAREGGVVRVAPYDEMFWAEMVDVVINDVIYPSLCDRRH